MAHRNMPSPKNAIFDRHSSLMVFTSRSAMAFMFGARTAVSTQMKTKPKGAEASRLRQKKFNTLRALQVQCH
jgi:hypothetical protein